MFASSRRLNFHTAPTVKPMKPSFGLFRLLNGWKIWSFWQLNTIKIFFSPVPDVSLLKQKSVPSIESETDYLTCLQLNIKSAPGNFKNTWERKLTANFHQKSLGFFHENHSEVTTKHSDIWKMSIAIPFDMQQTCFRFHFKVQQNFHHRYKHGTEHSKDQTQ